VGYKDQVPTLVLIEGFRFSFYSGDGVGWDAYFGR
jgi:hypothetical protein